MQKTRYVIAVVLIVIALAGLTYYLIPSIRLKNVDLIRETTANSLTGVDSSRIEYYPGSSGYLASPQVSGKLPGVVMIHEWWGLNDNIMGMAQQLAKEGYVVLAVDLYNGKIASSPAEASGLVSKVNSTEAVKNLRAAFGYLKTNDKVNPARIGSIGWCFGGGQSLRLALSGEQLSATVIYYGQLETDASKLSVIKWPVLGIFGDKDQSIPVDSVRAFEAALKQDSIPVEIHIYAGVGHAFANPSSQTYAPKEALDAWQNTLTFFKNTLKQ